MVIIMVMTWVMVSIMTLTPEREASPAGRGSGAPAGSSARRRRAGEEYWTVIGQYWSRDLNTDLLLDNTDHMTKILLASNSHPVSESVNLSLFSILQMGVPRPGHLGEQGL